MDDNELSIDLAVKGASFLCTKKFDKALEGLLANLYNRNFKVLFTDVSEIPSTGSASYIADSGSSIITATNDVLVTWVDRLKYTISYNANGGSGAPSSHNKQHGATATLSTVKPTYSGKVFTGWNTKTDGSGISYTDEQEVLNLTTINNDIINLYAQWEK